MQDNSQLVPFNGTMNQQGIIQESQGAAEANASVKQQSALAGIRNLLRRAGIFIREASPGAATRAINSQTGVLVDTQNGVHQGNKILMALGHGMWTMYKGIQELVGLSHKEVEQNKQILNCQLGYLQEKQTILTEQKVTTQCVKELGIKIDEEKAGIKKMIANVTQFDENLKLVAKLETETCRRVTEIGSDCKQLVQSQKEQRKEAQTAYSREEYLLSEDRLSEILCRRKLQTLSTQISFFKRHTALLKDKVQEEKAKQQKLEEKLNNYQSSSILFGR